jgi:formylglycine-generating enzyme required for sulfatase activity
MRKIAAVLSLVLGCTYQPTIPAGVISCDPAGAKCPTGYVCSLAGGRVVATCNPVGLPAGEAGVTISTDGGPDAALPADAPLADASTADAPARADAAQPEDAPTPDATPDRRAGEPLPTSVPAGACLASGRGPDMVKAGEFCIDATEVTNRQYQAFLEEADLTKQPAGCAANLTFVPENTQAPWPPTGREEHPVVNVDWCDAAAFCQWSGKRLCGRLGGGALDPKEATSPSASRWGSACTHAGMWKLPYGPDFKADLCNTGRAALPLNTEAAGSRPGCQGGYEKLYDMVGNVEEWVDACRNDPASGDVCAVASSNYFAPREADCTRVAESRRLTRAHFIGFRCCWP